MSWKITLAQRQQPHSSVISLSCRPFYFLPFFLKTLKLLAYLTSFQVFLPCFSTTEQVIYFCPLAIIAPFKKSKTTVFAPITAPLHTPLCIMPGYKLNLRNKFGTLKCFSRQIGSGAPSNYLVVVVHNKYKLLPV